MIELLSILALRECCTDVYRLCGEQVLTVALYGRLSPSSNVASARNCEPGLGKQEGNPEGGEENAQGDEGNPKGGGEHRPYHHRDRFNAVFNWLLYTSIY